MPNINPETGIPYGVVSLHSLAEWVCEEFTYHGVNLTYEEEKRLFFREHPGASEEEWEEHAEQYCPAEEEYYLERDRMQLGLFYLGGAPLVWVYYSPVTRRCRPCSPCIPGAGDLDSPDPKGMECYTLLPEWWGEEEGNG